MRVCHLTMLVINNHDSSRFILDAGIERDKSLHMLKVAPVIIILQVEDISQHHNPRS